LFFFEPNDSCHFRSHVIVPHQTCALLGHPFVTSCTTFLRSTCGLRCRHHNTQAGDKVSSAATPLTELALRLMLYETHCAEPAEAQSTFSVFENRRCCCGDKARVLHHHSGGARKACAKFWFRRSGAARSKLRKVTFLPLQNCTSQRGLHFCARLVLNVST
jgi:hypothetical protein